MQTEVRRNDNRSRYELLVEGEVIGVADFRDAGDAVVLPHTEILPTHRGQGWGDVLVRAALDDLRSTGATVVPTCWFVAEYIEAHPEYQELLVRS